RYRSHQVRPGRPLSFSSIKMATTRDNVTIELIIAGEPIKLLVPFDQQDKVGNANARSMPYTPTGEQDSRARPPSNSSP
ncbi:MAG: hypothetical protein K2K29_03595, partial [Muribaculaceae bacterium]|nr:hypothetical protein [Muribaculaceae bacterium]